MKTQQKKKTTASSTGRNRKALNVTQPNFTRDSLEIIAAIVPGFNKSQFIEKLIRDAVAAYGITSKKTPLGVETPSVDVKTFEKMLGMEIPAEVKASLGL